MIKSFFCFIVLNFLLLSPHLVAELSVQGNNAKEIEVLNSLDVPLDFLYDPNFLEIKNSLNAFKVKEYNFKVFKSASEFIPALQAIFLEQGIPQEFLYLAMAESAFSLTAVSKKRAVGLWQFMPQTAKTMGLRINGQIDERKDIILSTQAAVLYLKSLKEQFGKWYLAAIAYNCGDGRLRRAIREAGSDELGVLLDTQKKYIPKESRIYIRKIIATSLVFRDISTLEINDYDYFLNQGANKNIAKVLVPQSTPLKQIARLAGVSWDTLKKYNPQFKGSIAPKQKGEYAVYFPYTHLAQYKEKLMGPQKIVFHSVKKGDSLYEIAKKYGVSIESIKKANRIDSKYLQLGQQLLIPQIPLLEAKQEADATQSHARNHL